MWMDWISITGLNQTVLVWYGVLNPYHPGMGLHTIPFLLTEPNGPLKWWKQLKWWKLKTKHKYTWCGKRCTYFLKTCINFCEWRSLCCFTKMPTKYVYLLNRYVHLLANVQLFTKLPPEYVHLLDNLYTYFSFHHFNWF